MPPKPGTKGKKGKLSKAEKERLKKEELEQKAREEEELRLKAEQEERERLERERLEWEERERIEAAESQRYQEESEALQSILDGNRDALTSLLEDRKQKAKWSRYMRCDGSPDPTVPAEINTYINLWREDADRNSLKAVLGESEQTLALIGELEGHLQGAGEDDAELSDAQLLDHGNTLTELEDLLATKLDAATFELLKEATYNAHSESGNLQLVEGNESITLMLWGNLTKNPRFKSFEFPETGLTFELPKQLALSDIAVRFIQTKFDHYSHRCRTFALRRKKKAVEENAEVTDDGEGGTNNESEEGNPPQGQGDGADEGQAPAAGDVDTGEQPASEDTEAVPTNQGDEESEVKEEDTADGEGAPDSGEPAVSDEEEEDDENEFEDEDTVDLRAYQVMGSVLTFDLLTLPPQPKQVKGWIMTQVTSSELQRVPYPAEGDGSKLGQTLSGTIAMGQTLDSKVLADVAAATEALGAPPIGIKFRLPENVLFSEEPQLVYWSEEGKHWRLDGFTDIKYDEAERMMTFKTTNFGRLACIQDKHINMPYQSWELLPMGHNHTKLTILAAVSEIEIEIKDELCCFHLTPDSEPKPDLDQVISKWMAPQDLIKAMKSAGVNLFPDRDSKKYVTITEKDVITEEFIYQQMALTASNFAYSWSKWNSEADPEKVVLMGAEKLDGTPVNEDDWSLLMVRRDRCFKLKIKEYDEDFSDSFAEDSQFHAGLYHMVLELASPAGRERMSADFKFVEAVRQILSATKVITYS